MGKGTKYRATDHGYRSQWWHRVVNKHGLIVSIVQNDMIEEDAFLLEMWLIAKFRHEGHPLVNKTDGGEGSTGYVPTPELRKYMSKLMTGRKKPPGFGDKVSKRMSGEGNIFSKLNKDKDFVERRSLNIRKKDIFTFFNPVSSSIFIGTQSEFQILTGGSSGGVSSLVSGRRKSLYKWVVLV